MTFKEISSLAQSYRKKDYKKQEQRNSMNAAHSLSFYENRDSKDKKTVRQTLNQPIITSALGIKRNLTLREKQYVSPQKTEKVRSLSSGSSQDGNQL